MSLADLVQDTPAVVAALEGADTLTERLMEMGLVPGAAVTVLRASRMGSPLEVWVQGYRLCLRSSDARRVRLA